MQDYLFSLAALGFWIVITLAFFYWPAKWRPAVRRNRRELAEAEATQEREEAQARIQERRKWWPWVHMAAWDDAYQRISEQAGIGCTKDCENRGRNQLYTFRCPLHGHRSRTLSPVYRHYRHHHLEDAQPVLDRLDITPPRYTNEGTLL